MLLGLTFLLPGDDLSVGVREEEIKLHGHVCDKVLQDSCLLAAHRQRGAVRVCTARHTHPRQGPG